MALKDPPAHTITGNTALPEQHYSTQPVDLSPGFSLRDSRGLQTNIEYVFNEDGTVNYLAMAKPEHFFFNGQKAPEIAKKYGIDATKVRYAKVADFDLSTIDENHILISLAGLRYLARLRGFREFRGRLVTSTADFASVEMHSTWIGNYESNFLEETMVDGADAGHHNTFDFASRYMTAIAFNRAFCRVVRGYLNIKVVSKDEMGPDIPQVKKEDAKEESLTANLAHSPIALFMQYYEKLAKKYKWKAFKDFTAELTALTANSTDYKFETMPATWTAPATIPHNDLCTCLNIFQNKM